MIQLEKAFVPGQHVCLPCWTKVDIKFEYFTAQHQCLHFWTKVDIKSEHVTVQNQCLNFWTKSSRRIFIISYSFRKEDMFRTGPQVSPKSDDIIWNFLELALPVAVCHQYLYCNVICNIYPVFFAFFSETWKLSTAGIQSKLPSPSGSEVPRLNCKTTWKVDVWEERKQSR